MFSALQYFYSIFVVINYSVLVDVSVINVNKHSNSVSKHFLVINVTEHDYISINSKQTLNNSAHSARKTKKINLTEFNYGANNLGINETVDTFKMAAEFPRTNVTTQYNNNVSKTVTTKTGHGEHHNCTKVNVMVYLNNMQKVTDINGTEANDEPMEQLENKVEEANNIPIKDVTGTNVTKRVYESHTNVSEMAKANNILIKDVTGTNVPEMAETNNILVKDVTGTNVPKMVEANNILIKDVKGTNVPEMTETNNILMKDVTGTNVPKMVEANNILIKDVTGTNIPEIPEGENIDTGAHLKFKRIIDICQRRDEVCKSNDPNVCTLRYVHSKEEYRDFVNTCYLFLSNMCDYPGVEFNIADSGTCKDYLNSRRSVENSPDIRTNLRTTLNNYTKNANDTKSVTSQLRTAVPTFSKLYDIDTAFDYHICPSSCPDVYSPVCFNVNRNHGMHFKYFTFINHCSGDMYYCKHWEEFLPPPGMDEMVRQSGLGWTFCGSNRYIQFHRFSEAASSMGHYGWLAGDYRFSHIMEPHQRIPGFG